MTPSNSLKLACGGLLAMAAALGIGRFVYTPILPLMVDALGWSQADAGFVASANFLGYLIGALVAGHRLFAAAPRQWLLIALALSAATTAGMGLATFLPVHIGLRFGGGVASALVIICASTLVLDSLASDGRGHLSAVHFAGVGVGVVISAAVVSVMIAIGAGWRELWLASGLIAAIAGVIAAILLQSGPGRPFAVGVAQTGSGKTGLASMIAAYGLFGFGYVITATFLVTIVRQTREIHALEPWIWILFGLAAVPSVPLWQMVGRKIGLAKAYAVACVMEAAGVAASVEW